MRNLKHFLVAIFFFFFVYDVRLKGLPSLLSSRKLSLVFLAIMSIIHYQKTKGIILKIPRLKNGKESIYKAYVIGIFCIWCYSILIAVFNGRLKNDYVDARNLMFFMLYSVIAPFFLRYLFKDWEELFKTLIFVGIIQTVIIYALFLFPGLPAIFDKLFETDARFGYTSTIRGRVLGLGSGGAALSVLLFLSLYSLGYFLFAEKNVIFSSLMYAFILGATLLTGRTGFFAGIFLAVIIVWKKVLRNCIKKKLLLKVFVAFLFVIALMGFALEFAMRDEILSNKVVQLLSFIKISKTFSVHGNSFLKDILKMNLPEISLELLYGAGFGRGLSFTGVNVQNDIGYVQRIFSLGLFFGTAFYLTNFICFWKISSKLKKANYRFYYRILIFALFVFELKETFFYYYLVPSIILLMGLIDVCDKDINRNPIMT